MEVVLGAGSELLVRSPGVMLGYWQRPEATQQAIDAERWLHTGDVAGLIDGHVHIRGRIKEHYRDELDSNRDSASRDRLQRLRGAGRAGARAGRR